MTNQYYDYDEKPAPPHALTDEEVKQHLHDYILYNIILGIFGLIAVIATFIWNNHTFLTTSVKPNDYSYDVFYMTNAPQKVKITNKVGQPVTYTDPKTNKIQQRVIPLGIVIARPKDRLQITPQYVKVNQGTILNSKKVNYLQAFQNSLNLRLQTNKYQTELQSQSENGQLPTYLLAVDSPDVTPHFFLSNSKKVNVVLRRRNTSNLEWINYFRGTDKIRFWNSAGKFDL